MQHVTFTSKMNRSFRNIIITIIGTILILFAGPFLLSEDNRLTTDIWILTILFSLTVGMILWCMFDIKYVFNEEHLYLRAGFLFTRIRYEDIESYRHIEGIMDGVSGFNLLNSTKALGIMSQKVILGEVKISPADQEGFIQELEKRMQAVRS